MSQYRSDVSTTYYEHSLGPGSSVLAVCNFTGLSSKRFGEDDEEMGKYRSIRTWQDNDLSLWEHCLQRCVCGGGA